MSQPIPPMPKSSFYFSPGAKIILWNDYAAALEVWGTAGWAEVQRLRERITKLREGILEARREGCACDFHLYGEDQELATPEALDAYCTLEQRNTKLECEAIADAERIAALESAIEDTHTALGDLVLHEGIRLHAMRIRANFDARNRDVARLIGERDALQAQVRDLESRCQKAEAWPFKDGKGWVRAQDLREVEAERDDLVAQVRDLQRTIECMTETASENSRVKIEDHNQIMALQDQIQREGKMIAAQAGLRADLQRRADSADRLAEALGLAWDLINGHDGCPNWDMNDVEPYDRLRAFVKERLRREGR